MHKVHTLYFVTASFPRFCLVGNGSIYVHATVSYAPCQLTNVHVMFAFLKTRTKLMIKNNKYDQV